MKYPDERDFTLYDIQEIDLLTPDNPIWINLVKVGIVQLLFVWLQLTHLAMISSNWWEMSALRLLRGAFNTVQRPH